MTTNFFYSILLGLLTFLISIVLLSYQTGGDQIVYRDLYESLSTARLNEIIFLGYSYLDGGEPLSIFILWVGAVLGIKKNIYISILNVTLILLLVNFLKKYKVPKLMIGFLLCNFYLIVLMTTAERLKISYIFLFAAANLAGKKQLLFLLLSLVSHFQNLILLSGLFFGKIFDFFKFFRKKLLSLNFYYLIILSFIFGFLIYTYLFEFISYKFWAYYSQFTFSEFYNIIILIILAFIVLDKKGKLMMMLLPTLLAIYLVGNDRVNMVGFTIVTYELIINKKMSNFIVYLLMLYFVIKSVLFVAKIIEFGDGFV